MTTQALPLFHTACSSVKAPPETLNLRPRPLVSEGMVLHRISSPLWVFGAAAGCYAVNCALGASVALKLVDTSGCRWLHHTLYIATVTLTAVALSSALWGRPRDRSRRAALAALPAVIPLAAIPYAGTRTLRHPLLALTVAPFLVAGVIHSKG